MLSIEDMVEREKDFFSPLAVLEVHDVILFLKIVEQVYQTMRAGSTHALLFPHVTVASYFMLADSQVLSLECINKYQVNASKVHVVLAVEKAASPSVQSAIGPAGFYSS